MRAAWARVRGEVDRDTLGFCPDQYPLSTLATGGRLGCSDPLSASLRPLEQGQLSASSVILMLQLLELRFEVGLFLFVQGGTFLT